MLECGGGSLLSRYDDRADELAGRPRAVGEIPRFEESPDFTEQGDC